MSGNGQDHQLPDVPGPVDDGQEDEDDDFGEFEGFEGGVERMQAQPAPSPWATFPDLLPVQSSPATPAEENQSAASSSRNQNLPGNSRDMWQPQPPPNNGAQWAPGLGANHEEPRPMPQPMRILYPVPGANHEEPRPMPQPMRVLNPPDVSLGTNQAVGGRVTPDNVHDAALAVVMDHLDNNIDARLPVAHLERLREQLDAAEQGRAMLEEQVVGLRQRNVELEQQVVSSQVQINDLHTRLQRNQEALEQRLSEMRQFNTADWRQDLRQIQEEIVAIKQSQLAERSELEASRQNLEEMRTGICNRLQVLESNIQREYEAMEHRLSKQFDEQCHQVKAAIETVVQQTAQQVTGNLSQLVCEAVQNSNCGDSQGNLLQSIKVELEKHKDQQKRVLEEERQRQLITVSSALQSALQHLNSAINNDSKVKDGNNLS